MLRIVTWSISHCNNLNTSKHTCIHSGSSLNDQHSLAAIQSKFPKHQLFTFYLIYTFSFTVILCKDHFSAAPWVTAIKSFTVYVFNDCCTVKFQLHSYEIFLAYIMIIVISNQMTSIINKLIRH